jgi:hypothetical protein
MSKVWEVNMMFMGKFDFPLLQEIFIVFFQQYKLYKEYNL